MKISSQQSSRILNLYTLLSCLMLLWSTGVANAQRVAVVVGVDEYTYLSNSNLDACVNDAHQMRTLLEARGFRVISLTDKEARADAILETLTNLKGHTDQFVFYFSGHGSQGENDTAYILPSDFQDKETPVNALTVEHLYNAVRGVGASATTIILDSCYSGAMMKSRPLRDNLQAHGIHAKYYAMRQLREGPTHASGRADGANALPGNGQVCYFTASSRDQPSWTHNGHSVFTAQLCRLMGASSSSWGAVQQAVSEGVATEISELSREIHVQLQQDPQLTYSFLKRLPLLNTPVDTGPANDTLADILQLSNPEPNALSLEMSIGGQSSSALSLPKDTEVVFHAQAGQAGYLIVLNRHVDGKTSVLFPHSLHAADGYMTPRDSKRIPENPNNSLSADEVGMEGIKAILFASQSQAQQVLDRFRSNSGESEEFTYGQLRSRKLHEGPTRPQNPINASGFYTAEAGFEVREP